ncbi:RidA family protein [Streptomyces sp. NPDC058471]|uniref:RidA family protein n=1 Tax=Streptomyces sp. NPDC058471 TaxID=3346516 RepID=UPI003663ECDF
MSSNESAATAGRVEKIATTPDWYAPYRISQAVRAGGFVYVSGQAGFEEDGTTVEGGFLAQGRQAFRNVGRVLEAAGLTFADVIKVGIFVRDMATNLPHVVTLRGEFLAEPYPADTLVEVVSLAQPDWQVEVEVIALDRSAA